MLRINSRFAQDAMECPRLNGFPRMNWNRESVNSSIRFQTPHLYVATSLPNLNKSMPFKKAEKLDPRDLG